MHKELILKNLFNKPFDSTQKFGWGFCSLFWVTGGILIVEQESMVTINYKYLAVVLVLSILQISKWYFLLII